MSQDRFGIYPASFTYAGPTTLNLQQLNRVGVRPDAKKDTCIPGGAIDPTAVVLNYADPAVEIETRDLASVLAAVSVSAGLACLSGSIQFQKRADGGAFAAGSVHTVLSALKGFLFPKRLTVDQDMKDGAKLELEFRALWDGSSTGTPAQPVPPLTISATAALTSTPAFNSAYYLGPIYLAAAPLASIVGFQIDFGITFDTKRADGDLWPQVGSIIKREPKIRFRTRKADYAATIGSLYNADPGAALAFYLRKYLVGGARVADATTGHAKITVATSAWNADDFEVVDEQDTTVTVQVDATGVLASSVASTIP